MRSVFRCTTLFVALILGLGSLGTQAAATQPTTVSFWGINAYLTKRERVSAGDSLGVLVDTTRATGAQWTREELPWALIESKRGQRTGIYDGSLKLTADNGFGIIGMLLTTPEWARDPSCRTGGPTYWCPPANPADYAVWAGWMTERYDGDGVNDAPGSPRIAAWEIWNEPNDTFLWPLIGSSDDARKQRYGDMLVRAYAAIKRADPTALVLTGGTYIYDGGCHMSEGNGVCDGLNFFNAANGMFPQVPAAKQAFDVFAIHPFISTNRPDAPEIPRIITLEGRIRATRQWLTNDIGRGQAPIWITEMGWCTAGGTCPGGVAVSEDAQANYLMRSLVIAQGNGVQHASWFQLEDAFNDHTREWSYAALVHDYDGTGYPTKPAYAAYRTLVAQLGDAVPVGVGPANQHVWTFDSNNPYAATGSVVYDYRYTRGPTVIDVLWVPEGTQQVVLPIMQGAQVTKTDRDGAASALLVANDAVTLGLSERPVLVVQTFAPVVMGPYHVALPVVVH